MENFFNFTRAELSEFISERFSAPQYTAQQLFDWVYRKGISDFSQMSNIAKDVRAQLASEFSFPEAETSERQLSQDGTRKYLFKVPSGQTIETVLIAQPNRKTLCVSSQYGCGMGCKFCRTGTMGFIANLDAADIVAQVRGVLSDCKTSADSFSNMVFMGMGEPLHNLKNITKAIRILTDPYAFEIAPRKITVSTVGLVPAIEKFAEEDLGVNLAVSLNATTDEIRSEIMPVNKAFPIEKLLSTLRNFPLKGRKKITIEYVMLAGVNDHEEDLSRLSKILRGIRCKINLIPYNENAQLGFKTPSENKINSWLRTLTDKGIDVTVRWSKGKDINAACGQLATEVVKKNKISVFQ